MSRVVVVSGGGTGIGRAVAERFAADGARVVLIGRREDVLKAAAAELGDAHPDAPGPLPVVADLAEPEQAEAAGEAIRQRYGRVDVLVHCAGGNVALQGRPALDSTVATAADHWNGNLRANVLTAVLLTEALRELLGERGRIVFISSIAAYRGSGSGSYAASKAALHPYCYDLAAALGPTGTTVNVVAPGFVAGTEFFAGRMTEQRHATMVQQTMNGRAGTVQDVADTVHWLSSPFAGHVTGQVIQVNGGAERGR
ncbi:SDR family NAD(P)-dependent oxidoreductase [Micromonospora sp. DT228]|uniref:SDR family NAD(P)-dependent oxidoreductase n=1 Tax=Micromonospora sp. DT228 TaxID=3393443 RepID=UPI003CF73569